jgi:hypothetical protein
VSNTQTLLTRFMKVQYSPVSYQSLTWINIGNISLPHCSQSEGSIHFTWHCGDVIHILCFSWKRKQLPAIQVCQTTPACSNINISFRYSLPKALWQQLSIMKITFETVVSHFYGRWLQFNNRFIHVHWNCNSTAREWQVHCLTTLL